MKRKASAPVFKPYVMNQVALLPPSYDEKIPADHLIRVVNAAVEKIDLSSLLLAQYPGGGRSSYHPLMMLKVLVYAYHVKLEHYFLDGTKIEADANKHKVVWAKKRDHYHQRVQAQIKDLLKHIEQVNEQEQLPKTGMTICRRWAATGRAK